MESILFYCGFTVDAFDWLLMLYLICMHILVEILFIKHLYVLDSLWTNC